MKVSSTFPCLAHIESCFGRLERAITTPPLTRYFPPPGGFVYRGTKYGDLLGGNYVFADFSLK